MTESKNCESHPYILIRIDIPLSGNLILVENRYFRDGLFRSELDTKLLCKSPSVFDVVLLRNQCREFGYLYFSFFSNCKAWIKLFGHKVIIPETTDKQRGQNWQTSPVSKDCHPPLTNLRALEGLVLPNQRTRHPQPPLKLVSRISGDGEMQNRGFPRQYASNLPN